MTAVMKVSSWVYLAVAGVATYAWIRGGMWPGGELPTHGFIAAAGLSLSAFAFARANLSGEPKHARPWCGAGVSILVGFAVAFAMLRP
ncbi:MAG: hypothetical protein HQL35_15515 [Alphaproteobacteria bacterium]|nr:hypothetical protein [Alphaproteobacteria bacterium]